MSTFLRTRMSNVYFDIKPVTLSKREMKFYNSN